jgi:hypothetical protein
MNTLAKTPVIPMDIYKDRYCVITYDACDNLIYLRWYAQPDLKALMKIYNTGIDLAIKFKATGWIADNSIGIYFDVNMQRTLAELTARRMFDTYIQRFAHIISYDVFQELVTHKILGLVNELADHSVEFEVFTNAIEARNWTMLKRYAKTAG